MGVCAKCGQEVGGFSGLLSHACQPKNLTVEERRLISDTAKLWQQEPQRAKQVDDLDRQIEMANERDFGPGQEQSDRFGDSSRVVKVWNSETRQFNEQRLDRTGSALRSEAESGGTPAFDAEAEMPKDPHDRSVFRARHYLFPREQIARLREDKVLYHGGNLKEGKMSPEEQAEFNRTGKSPEVITGLKPHEPTKRESAFERFRVARAEAQQGQPNVSASPGLSV